MLKSQLEEHLKKVIIPFWKQLKDDRNGGFYGYYDFERQLHKEADKGVILHSRILWFFSNGFMVTEDKECYDYATWCYSFIKDFCIDREFGGVYWSLDYMGLAVDDTKYTHNIAFAIYGLSSYYKISKNKECLEIAYGLFRLIEERMRDKLGYMDHYTRDYHIISNEEVSENGVVASRSINTLLHILEAYIELYELEHKKEVGLALLNTIRMFKDTLYNKDKKMMEVFLDEKMNAIMDLNSFGHDIEASWLIDKGVEVLRSYLLSEESEVRYEYLDFFYEVSEMTEEIREHIIQVAYHGNSLMNESLDGVLDRKRVWWVQAEAAVGFMNGYEKTNKKNYLDAVLSIWEYIKDYMIDKRDNSEWFYEVDEHGVANSEKEIAGPWKCPYHNGRMCFELMKRLKML